MAHETVTTDCTATIDASTGCGDQPSLDKPKRRRKRSNVHMTAASEVDAGAGAAGAEKGGNALDSDAAQARDPGRRKGDKPKRVPPAKAVPQPPAMTKTALVLAALRRRRGASLGELQEITGWQPHSVRGFLSGTVRKKLGLPVIGEVGKDGVRRYRIEATAKAG